MPLSTSPRWLRVLIWLGAVLVLGALSPSASASPGSLDPTFGVGGIARVDLGAAAPQEARLVAVRPDGSLVVVGVTGPGRSVAVARLSAAGVLDTSFGTGGVTTLVFRDTSEAAPGAIALLGDGRILVAANARLTAFDDDTIAVARLTEDGQLDGTFGVGGTIVDPLASPSEVHAVRILPDGRIVIAGMAYDNLAVLQLLDNGALDASFAASTGGVGLPTFGACTSIGWDVVRREDGRLLAAGGASCTSTGNLVAFAQWGADGTADRSFSADGSMLVPPAPTYGFPAVKAMALRPDGRAVGTGPCAITGDSARLGLVSIGPDGSFDPALAGSGITCSVDVDVDPQALLLDSSGRLVVAGVSLHPGGPGLDLALARLSGDGVPDSSFGDAGVARIDVGDQTEKAWSVAEQADGKIVVAGSSGLQAVVARLESGGSSGSPGRVGFGPYTQYTGGEYVAETAGQVTLTVKRVAGSDGPVSVDYRTEGGTATEGTDYVGAQGTLTWLAGETADRTLTVTILPDTVPNESESFSVRLSNVTGGASIGQGAEVALVVICDDLGSCSAGTGSSAQTQPQGNDSGGGCLFGASRLASADLDALRSLRDRFLSRSAPGRALVRLYYGSGAELVPVVRRHAAPRMLVRALGWTSARLARTILPSESRPAPRGAPRTGP